MATADAPHRQLKKSYSDFELAVIFKYALKAKVVDFNSENESDKAFLYA
jgi:hypothetical protein